MASECADQGVEKEKMAIKLLVDTIKDTERIRAEQAEAIQRLMSIQAQVASGGISPRSVKSEQAAVVQSLIKIQDEVANKSNKTAVRQALHDVTSPGNGHAVNGSAVHVMDSGLIETREGVASGPKNPARGPGTCQAESPPGSTPGARPSSGDEPHLGDIPAGSLPVGDAMDLHNVQHVPAQTQEAPAVTVASVDFVDGGRQSRPALVKTLSIQETDYYKALQEEQQIAMKAAPESRDVYLSKHHSIKAKNEDETYDGQDMLRASADVLRADIDLSGHELAARDTSLFAGRTSDPYVIFKQEDAQVACTETVMKSLNPQWRRLQLNLVPDIEVEIECWDWDRMTGDDLIGKTKCMPEELLREGCELVLYDNDFAGRPTVTGNLCIKNVHVHDEYSGGSIVSMCQAGVFFKEGDSEDVTDEDHHYVSIKLFRVHYLEQRLAVRYSTVDGLGSAVPDKHYMRSHGTVFFEPGDSLAWFDIPIPDDEAWEPIRDFVVRLDEIIEGIGKIGEMDTTTVSVVDDDIWPDKRCRTENEPLKPSERFLPSCNNVSEFLTPDEIGDKDLLMSFIMERWRVLWPSSGWGLVWSIYRAFYTVGMSLATMVFLDFVFVEPALVGQDQARRASAGGGTGGSQRIEGGEYEVVDGYDTRMILAGSMSFVVILATIVQSNTETYVVVNSKCGLTGKQLRDWIVAQLMWADDGRLAMMRHADYLNAATSEVESVASCYEMMFPAIERFFHFVLNIILMIIYIDIPAGAPIATGFIIVLVPITIVTHWSRAHQTRLMLEKRIICERSYVSSLADIIENTQTFRGLGASNVRKAFGQDTDSFAKTHLSAVLFTVLTKERIEMVQGLILAFIFVWTAHNVNTGTMSKGAAVGLISAFLSGGDDISKFSEIALKMKFCTEGLRMVGRILNYPTDAHTLAEQAPWKAELMARKTSRSSCNGAKATRDSPSVVDPPPARSKDITSPRFSRSPSTNQERERHQEEEAALLAHVGTREPEESLEWINTVYFAETRHISSARKALQGARGELSDELGENRVTQQAPCVKVTAVFKLGGILLLKGPTDEDADTMLKLMVGTNVVGKEDLASIFVPPTLSYVYVSDMPVLLEGSILKNLLLGAKQTMHGRVASAKQAWEIAKRCGLDAEYLWAPESFNVGKGGRNLPMTARVAICISRGILADPSVLLLHKPDAMMSPEMKTRVFQLLRDFVDYGGLWGLLSGKQRPHGCTPTEFLLGKGTRTVLLTPSHKDRPMPPGVDGVVHFFSSWDTMDLRQVMLDRIDSDSEAHEERARIGSGGISHKLRQSLSGGLQSLSFYKKPSAPASAPTVLYSREHARADGKVGSQRGEMKAGSASTRDTTFSQRKAEPYVDVP